ncbi:MAG: hypothetical protein IV093_22680 [Rubrivivax sp.]|nr:hypothetical protein [Rubrivivax sp.]
MSVGTMLILVFILAPIGVGSMARHVAALQPLRRHTAALGSAAWAGR